MPCPLVAVALLSLQTIHVLRINFYIGSASKQLLAMGDSQATTGNRYLHTFTVLLPYVHHPRCKSSRLCTCLPSSPS